MKYLKGINWIEDITALALVGTGAAWLYAFSTIKITGGYMAFEPNIAVLIGEIILSICALILGLRAFIKRIRLYRNK